MNKDKKTPNTMYCDMCGREFPASYLNLRIIKVNDKTKGVALCNDCEITFLEK